MNSNTLLRHDVFESDAMVNYIAGRIADESEIRRGKQFPYQYFAAYLNVDDDVPQKIKTALHKAAEIACGNVPELPGPVVIDLDTSGSMSSAVNESWVGTGRHGSLTLRTQPQSLRTYFTSILRLDSLHFSHGSDHIAIRKCR